MSSSSNRTGQLTWSEFERCISEIADIRDGWQLIKHKDEPGCTYLQKKQVRVYNEEKGKDAGRKPTHAHLVEPQDAFTLNENETKDIITWDYHIVYSSSYEVPVLYFNAYKKNGSLVSLENIWKSIPSVYSNHEERWSTISQQEHPLLGIPFFVLHPCHTSEMMRATLGKIQKPINYVISWLSICAPLIGLEIPLFYAQRLENISHSKSVK